MEVNENRLVETEQEITNLKTDIVPVVPDLERFRRGLEESLSSDFEVKRRTYVDLIDRIVFYDHAEISIEFNLQNINQNPDNSAPDNGSKFSPDKNLKSKSKVIPQSTHDNSCTRIIFGAGFSDFRFNIGAFRELISIICLKSLFKISWIIFCELSSTYY